MYTLWDPPIGLFPPGAHPVSYFFGFHEFVVAVAQDQSWVGADGSSVMKGELTKAKILNSLLQIAANNTNFNLPVLVQGNQNFRSVLACYL